MRRYFESHVHGCLGETNCAINHQHIRSRRRGSIHIYTLVLLGLRYRCSPFGGCLVLHAPANERTTAVSAHESHESAPTSTSTSEAPTLQLEFQTLNEPVFSLFYALIRQLRVRQSPRGMGSASGADVGATELDWNMRSSL